jgi:hypothetical protein
MKGLRRRRRVTIHLNEDEFRALERYADALGAGRGNVQYTAAALVVCALLDKGLVRCLTVEGWVAVEGPMPEHMFSSRPA